ncbi:PBECR4 domain-containing protein [Eubacterium limosum]|uniref:PBECR4 domain-containing protein n=1 Tax=Eubacterium limosum TaxID=1736 RepID=UPI001558E0BA|nr:PBECR4 domain-containing protein [Eubacterium limosum]
MDRLKECAERFKQYLNIDYQITAVRKEKELCFKVFFQKSNFHHLAGLHKLTDLPHISRVRNKGGVFHDVLKSGLSYAEISKSCYIGEVDKRIKYFDKIESLFEKEIILKFDSRKAYSTIQATMLLYDKIDNTYLHLFLNVFEENSPDNIKLIPCSFFSSDNRKYIDGQEVYKIKKLEKIIRSH